MNKPKAKGLKSIPSQVQLPGGVSLKAMPFKIVDYNDDGTPKLFELQPANVHHDMSAEDACVLFAQEAWIRASRVGKSETGRNLDRLEAEKGLREAIRDLPISDRAREIMSIFVDKIVLP